MLEDTGMKTIQELKVIAEGHEDYEMHMELNMGVPWWTIIERDM